MLENMAVIDERPTTPDDPETDPLRDDLESLTRSGFSWPESLCQNNLPEKRLVGSPRSACRVGRRDFTSSRPQNRT